MDRFAGCIESKFSALEVGAKPRQRSRVEAPLEVREALAQDQFDFVITILVEQVKDALRFCHVCHGSNLLEALEKTIEPTAASQDFQMEGGSLAEEVERHLSGSIRSQFSPPVR
jgi:hypothetical protein